MVEIGTGSGVSGLALFAGMQPDGVLTSVDIETEHQQAAREAFRSVGIPPQRFRLIAGSALNVLPRLSDGAYDLVFVDADKLEYAEYVEQAVRLLRHGGVLAVDNALWHDRTADATNTDDQTEAMRSALATVERQRGPDLRPAPGRRRPAGRRQAVARAPLSRKGRRVLDQLGASHEPSRR